MNNGFDASRPGEITGHRSTPDLVDGFDDFRQIGSGGFSSVYSARQVRMGRPVAIKILHSDISEDTDRRTFERECQAMGVLSRHPNIVTVYSEAYTIDDRACLVMELHHGNYRERLDDGGPLALDEVLSVGVKIAGALQAAHDTGILHRDIKPHNIFVSDFGEPALGDFGISTIEDERSITGAEALSVAYSAPEILDDGLADFLSDVYSLAATLYHLTAGVAPFVAPQVGGVIERILSEDPDPLHRADAPASLDRLLRGGLSKNRHDRPESAGDLALSLQEIQTELGFEATAVPLRRSERFEAPTGPQPQPSSPSLSPSPDRENGSAASGLGRANASPGPADPEAEETLVPPGASRYEIPGRSSPPSPAHAPEADADPVADPLQSTVRRPLPGVGRPDERAETDASVANSGDAERRSSWGIDVAIIIAVVALVAFALSRML